MHQPEGVAKVLPLGDILPAEEKLLEVAIDGLKKNVKTGVEFVKKSA
jgi:hypothetical protein